MLSVAAEMNVTFTLEPADMKAFIAYNRKHRPAMKRTRYAMYLLFAVLSFEYAFAGAHPPTHRLAAFFVVFAIYFGVTWVITWLFQALVQWRTFTRKEQPGLFCEHTITLADDALLEVTPVNEGRHRWSGIYSILQTKQHIFVLVAANAAHIIPKRAFPDAQTANSFFQRATELYSEAHDRLDTMLANGRFPS